MQKKEPDKVPTHEVPVFWIETSESVSYRCEFDPKGQLTVSSIFFTLYYLYIHLRVLGKC